MGKMEKMTAESVERKAMGTGEQERRPRRSGTGTGLPSPSQADSWPESGRRREKALKGKLLGGGFVGQVGVHVHTSQGAEDSTGGWFSRNCHQQSPCWGG